MPADAQPLRHRAGCLPLHRWAGGQASASDELDIPTDQVLPGQPVLNDLLTLTLAQMLESFLVDGYLGPDADADAAALSGS